MECLALELVVTGSAACCKQADLVANELADVSVALLHDLALLVLGAAGPGSGGNCGRGVKRGRHGGQR